MRAKLLVLGSMDEFVDLVKRAKERGCEVVVADGYEQGPAREGADASFVVPVTDTETLAGICREQGVDALVTSFSDVLFEEGCRIAHEAGLPAPCSLEKLEYLRNKELMKRMFCDLGISHPRSCVVPADQVEHACASLRFPCVMKPVDGYGSYGVRVVRGAAEACEAAAEVAAESRRAAKVVLEEYDDGHEFNMVTWVVQGRVTVVSIADREKTSRGASELPHVSRIVYPSRFSAEVAGRASDYAQRVASFIGLENGPLCMQFFWSPETGVNVCEVTGRVFGYEHELLEHACGLSIEDLLLDTALDPDALVARLATHDALSMPRVSCGLYFHGRDGEIADLSKARAVLRSPLAKETLLYYEEGESIRNVRGGKPYAAKVFLAASTRHELDAETAHLFSEFSILGAQGEELAVPNEMPCAAQRTTTVN